MRFLICVFLLLFANASFAAKNPFDRAVQSCVRKELQIQYSNYYSRFLISDFATWALSDSSFEYMIFLANKNSNNIESRSFVSVKESDHANASLFFNENAKEVKIDLQKCF